VLSKVIRVDKDGVGLVFLPVAENGGANGRTRGAISRKAICRFLEHLESEKGHAIVGYTAENLDTENLDTENLDTENLDTENQEMNVIGPGNKFGRAWRRRHEKTYG
jgi:hypothetical protein